MSSALYPWQQFAEHPQFSHQLALQDSQGEVFTWQQVAEKIDHYADLLTAQGVTAQTGVALCGKNDLNLLLLYLATIQLGARVLPLNPAFTATKIEDICQQTQIAFYYAPLPLALSLSPIQFKNPPHFLDKSHIKVRSKLNEFLQPATLTLTSGSTGQAKAVVHSVQQHLDNAKAVCELMDFQATDSWLLSLPLYHISGQAIVWRWLSKGARLHLSQADFYQSVSQASHCSLVPTQLQRLIAHWKANPTLIQTRHILLGGAYISPLLTAQLAEFGVQSYSGYGMTEMASTVFAKKSNQQNGVGQLLSDREYRLVNQEIWLRGAGLAMGYWHNGAIQPLTNQEGWLQTKDKGDWQDNELHILGRIDNMFISGGENIQPEEIERLILQWHRVAQVFVLPKQDAEFGQRPVAFIQFSQPFSTALVAELSQWLANRIEKFKQPIQYFPLEPTEQSAVKISRKSLQQQFAFLLGQ